VRRGADFWSGLVPRLRWHSTVGRQLRVGLDQGEDFNAFYDRASLQFFHGPVDGSLVYSGESPDVVCHELGHAVLDALRPQLWDAASDEVAAFHESFGDMSAILSALQLTSVRDEVLATTGGKLARSSRLSRLAEQLGYAVRQIQPDAVDRDSLRNASNSLFYQDPTTLPPSAPASMLSSEPHSFSRVFSGAFLRALAGIFAAQRGSGSAALLQSSVDAAKLLTYGIRTSPVVPAYYSQVAAHMLEGDSAEFGGRYHDALKSAFVRHGVLSLDAATRLQATLGRAIPAARRARAGMVASLGGPVVARSEHHRESPALPRVALDGESFGLTMPLFVHAAAEPTRYAVASAAPDLRSVATRAHDHAAATFTESLFQRGRVELGDVPGAESAPSNPLAHKTHDLREEDGALLLVRRLFDCGNGRDHGSRYDGCESNGAQTQHIGSR
jgi:hypothetical protein